MPKPRTGRLKLPQSRRTVLRSPSPLLVLPVELVSLALSFLGPRDVLACRATCSPLRSIVDADIRLQLFLELAYHQLHPSSPPSPLPARTLLDAVRLREVSWRRLRWRNAQTCTMPAAGAIYEFVGGIYANARAGHDERRVNGAIVFYQLPDATTHPTPSVESRVRSWTLPVPDLVVLDFSLDPSQDLVVFIALADSQPSPFSPPPSPAITSASSTPAGGRYQIHFRTLSTNAPHPLARQPILSCAFEPGPLTMEAATTFRILVHGSLLLLLIKDVLYPSSCTYLSLTDWHLGPDASYAFPHELQVEDVLFLSPSEFLLVAPHGALDVYAFTRPPRPECPLRLLRRFELPRLKCGHRYWYATATANPAPGTRVYDVPARTGPTSYFEPSPALPTASQSSPNSRPNAASDSSDSSTGDNDDDDDDDRPRRLPPPGIHPPPFASRPDDGLVTVALGTLSPAPENHMSCYVLFIHAAQLLALARAPVTPWLSTSAGRRTSVNEEAPIATRTRRAMSISSASSSSAASSSSSSTLSSAGTSTLHSTSPPSSSSSSTLSSNSPATSHTPPTLRWADWGPPLSRLFRDRLSSDWQHAVHGFRTAERVLPDDPALRPLLRGQPPPPVHPIRHCVRVRDFNPCAMRDVRWGAPRRAGVEGALSESGDGGEKGEEGEWDEGDGDGDGEWTFTPDAAPSRIVRAPSRIRARDSETFAEDVESALPYREAVSEQAMAVSDIMMDDARILCLRRGAEGRLVAFDVLTF